MARPPADNSNQATRCPKRPIIKAEHLRETPVKIVVGTGDKAATYHLPPTPLKVISPYFRACLSDEFSEGATNVVHLRDANPAVFHHFVAWLLRIHDLGGNLDRTKPLIGLWILGDSIMCEDLQNRAMDVMRQLHLEYSGHDWHASAGCILFAELASIVAHTCEGSELSSYAMDKIAHAMTRGLKLRELMKSGAYWARIPETVKTEIFLRYQHYVDLGSKDSDPAQGEGCRYHVHDDTESRVTSENGQKAGTK
ncbi:uncharacterized protein AB675_8141 [Cyphellophora attinorum]|uniref:BTB domain-containing protein n=1 Tax=Cyphellophora attinorum TaxID=1664694 RepID=A0A0N0NN41_9EURO|nr:uncharacterized protein AB675_8141 [Phialophora attinorum]KPI41171.1 hypothetical protein AB675_8141 [Phialophora attinorum]